MAVTLTVYGGACSVGGNKILLDADGTAILFDFGTDFGIYRLYLDVFFNHRRRQENPEGHRMTGKPNTGAPQVHGLHVSSRY